MGIYLFFQTALFVVKQMKPCCCKTAAQNLTVLRLVDHQEDWKQSGASGAVLRRQFSPNLCMQLWLPAPLLKILGEEGGGVNFRGCSSIGKTTTLQPPVSIYGSPDFMKSCRTTVNGIEATGVLHNDLPLALDEIGQADPSDIGDMVYALANGRGRASQQNQVVREPSQSGRRYFFYRARKS